MPVYPPGLRLPGNADASPPIDVYRKVQASRDACSRWALKLAFKACVRQLDPSQVDPIHRPIYRFISCVQRHPWHKASVAWFFAALVVHCFRVLASASALALPLACTEAVMPLWAEPFVSLAWT